jgi:hypothetical protein
MGHYRLYFLDGFSGHINRFSELDASTDAAAISQALKSSTTAPMELWCGHRKVMRWEADTPPSTRTASRSSPSEVLPEEEE